MRKTYQNEDIDTNQSTVFEAVSVALTELAGEVHEGLLALAVGTGFTSVDRAHGTGCDRPVWGEGPSRSDTDGDTAWPRRRLGAPGRASGTGGAAADAR